MNIKGASGKGLEGNEGVSLEMKKDDCCIVVESWQNWILQLCGKQNT